MVHKVSNKYTIYPGMHLEYHHNDDSRILFPYIYIDNGEHLYVLYHSLDNYTPIDPTVTFIMKIWFWLFPKIDYTRFAAWKDEDEYNVKLNDMEIQL